MWLGRCFQKGLPKEGGPTLKMGSNTHGPGSWAELKGERETGSQACHTLPVSNSWCPPTASQDKPSLRLSPTPLSHRCSVTTQPIIFRVPGTSPLGDARGELKELSKLVDVCPALGHSHSIEETDNRPSCRPRAHISDSAGLTDAQR